MKCNKLQYIHVCPQTKQPSKCDIVGHLVCCLLGMLPISPAFNCFKCALLGHLVKRVQSETHCTLQARQWVSWDRAAPAQRTRFIFFFTQHYGVISSDKHLCPGPCHPVHHHPSIRRNSCHMVVGAKKCLVEN